MGELRLHAIGITEVREMFGASPELAARLRSVATEQFRIPAVENQPKKTLLHRIGPFFRDDPAWQVRVPEGSPTPNDWENLIAGRFIQPDRVDVSWVALDAWVTDLAWATERVTLTASHIDDLDMGLTMAGLPSRFGIRHLMKDDAQLNLRPGHRMGVGYAKYDHVIASHEALAEVIGAVSPQVEPLARQLLVFLGRFPDLAREARVEHRPQPDLFVVWWPHAG